MPGLEGTALGPYRLQQRLGRGGMSEVYLAYDEIMHREVAIKVVSSSHADYLERFHREAKAISMLYHDHILPAFDYGDQEPWHYLVMPYIAHGTLRNRLERGPLTLEEAGEMLAQIADALQYAHDGGIIHRDIKPSNILLRDDHYAYLADFGLAKVLEGTSDLTLSGTLMGTPEYMAPELSEGPATTSSDIYALAIILYQMVTGRVPFTANTPVAVYWKQLREQPVPPSHLNPAIPSAIERVILRALDKDPHQRFQSARALAQAYLEALEASHMDQVDEMPSLYDMIEIEDAQPRATPLEERALPYLYHQNPAASPLAGTASNTPHLDIPQYVPEEEHLILPGNPLQTPSAVPSSRDRAGDRMKRNSPFRKFPTRSTTPTNLPPSPSSAQAPPYDAAGHGDASHPKYPQYPQQRQQRHRPARRRRGNRVAIASIIGLIILLIFVALIVLTATLFSHVSGIQTQNAATATTQAQTNATGTALATNGAGTQTAQSTTTAVNPSSATATAIAAAASTVTIRAPLLTDGLSSNRNGWREDTNCVFTGGTYHVIVNLANFLQPCESNTLSFDNAAIQVDVSLLSGNDAGLIFRINGTQFYDFEITNAGQFFFRRHIAGANYDYLIPSTSSSAIAPGNAKNTILVIANGSDFKFYINGVFVGEQHDSTFVSGQIGFVAGTFPQTSSGEASFANLNVFKVS